MGNCAARGVTAQAAGFASGRTNSTFTSSAPGANLRRDASCLPRGSEQSGFAPQRGSWGKSAGADRILVTSASLVCLFPHRHPRQKKYYLGSPQDSFPMMQLEVRFKTMLLCKWSFNSRIISLARNQAENKRKINSIPVPFTR